MVSGRYLSFHSSLSIRVSSIGVCEVDPDEEDEEGGGVWVWVFLSALWTRGVGRRMGTGVEIGREVDDDDEGMVIGAFLASVSRSTIDFVVEGGADDEGEEEGKEE